MSDLVLSWLMILCLWGTVWSWMRYGPPWQVFGCAFFHRRKRYVGVFMRPQHGQYECSKMHSCSDLRRAPPQTIARWICDRCDRMGEDVITRGRWMVQHGELVPDEKAWANPEDK